MWNPTTEADDNKEDCKCSSSSVDKIGQKSPTLEQLPASSSLTTPNSNKEKLSNIDAPSKDKNQREFDSETCDSGFITGPQSEPIDFEEDEEDNKVVAATTSDKKSTAQTSTETSEQGDGSATGFSDSSAHASGKDMNDEHGYRSVLDSGCITGELYEEEDEEEEDDVVDADKAAEVVPTTTENNKAKENQSESKATSDFKSETTTDATPEEDNNTEQMKFKNSVEAGASEWMCKSESNNLNAVSSSRSSSSVNTPSNVQVGNNQSAPAVTPIVANRTAPAFPWETFYKQDDDGDTTLHMACISGCLEVITALIRMAPHPCLFNIKNDDSQTPLHIATLTAQPNIIRILLLAGAEPTVRDLRGNTALHLACHSGEIQCVRALTTTFAASEIHEAHRQYGHRSNDKALSSLSYARLPSDLEIRNYDGDRCVHLAAAAGNIDILRILVSHGADINAREGKAGRTPLHIAIESRNEDLANFLLDECEKLNLETATYAGLTAYQTAQILNNTQMTKMLEQHGAEPLTPPDSDIDYDSDDYDQKVSVSC